MAAVTMAIWKDCLWAELFDDEVGDGSPVSIIHVDDALFMRALARRDIEMSPHEARAAFLNAFPDRLEVQRWLVGSSKPGEALLPVLILCCLAASEAADSEENDYRRRLQDLMEWSHPIIHCEALPGLWARLARLSRKRSEGTPSRVLILPDPRFRSQIGHAIELTFPSRNDTRRLLNELGAGDFDFDAPRAVLGWLTPLVARKRFSPTFDEAFNEFREAWLAAERSLMDHRFWAGWKLATQGLRKTPASAPFEIVSDEWGLRHIIDPANERAIDLEAAIRGRSLPSSLIASLGRSHIIPLREEEWGRLQWVGSASPGKPPIAALIRQRAFSGRYQSFDCQRVVGAAGWGLTFQVAALFGERAPVIDRDRLLDAVPVGCTRVDGGVLARPSLPFVIETSGYVSDVKIKGALADRLLVEKLDPQTWRVTPRSPISTDVRLIAEPRSGGIPFERNLRLRRSILLPEFRETIPDRLFDGDPPPSELWPCDAPAGVDHRLSALTTGVITHPALLDLMEFLAIRTAPIPYGGFADIVRAAVGSSNISPWDVVQALRDAGAVKILDVRGWRGRAILSRPPRGALSRVEGGWALLFEGCLSETWVTRLVAAAGRRALAFESRPGVGEWSPPTHLVLARDVDVLRDLATEMETQTGFLEPSLAALDSLRVAAPITRTEDRPERKTVTLAGACALGASGLRSAKRGSRLGGRRRRRRPVLEKPR